jgi:hypothetical protein
MDRYFARLSCAVAALLAMVALCGPAGAQTDHLKCFKIKDLAQFKAATADLLPSSLDFVGENCSLKGKGAQLCVPASKTNVLIEDGVVQSVSADALTGAQLCYKVKCPTTASETVHVNDQFGTRDITKGKVSKVCGPAVEQ